MISNNLALSGLRTLFNVQAPTEPTVSIPSGSASQGGTSSSLAGVVKAKEDSVRVSESAKDLGETYKRLQSSGNKEAVQGFTKVVQSFGGAISGDAIKNVTTATGKMSSGDLQKYGETANAVSKEGNNAVMAKFANQAATAFNADEELGRTYMKAADSIMNAEYSGNKQEVADKKLANMNALMNKFGELGNPAKASKEDVAAFKGLANSVGEMGKGTEIKTTMANYTTPSKVSAVAG